MPANAGKHMEPERESLRLREENERLRELLKPCVQMFSEHHPHRVAIEQALGGVMAEAATPMWNREEVQRVLYEVVVAYEEAAQLGGDSEILRDRIRIARRTLQDNHWWPTEARGD